MNDRDLMIEDACRRLNSATKRGPNAYRKILLKLIEIGGSYFGTREDFFVSINGSKTSHVEPLKMLIRKKIVTSSRINALEYRIELNEDGLKAFVSGPDLKPLTKSLRTSVRCPECGCKAVEVVDNLCIGCYHRRNINIERKGFLKV
jgi:hypothetical protein